MTALCFAVLFLAGCGGGDSPKATSVTVTKVVTVTPPITIPPTTAASPTEAPSTEANVGDRALKIGETRHGDAYTTTVLEVRDPYPPDNSYNAADPGQRWYGVRVKQCQTKAVEGGPYYSSWMDWAVTDRTSAIYAANGPTDNGWPLPQFPDYASLTNGACFQGWVLISLPNAARPTTVLYQPEGIRLAEWIKP